ncbi:MAG: hypothetical protein OXG43_05605 [Chloroflexi bacterium]|nr:hypothetical protein [Chloroflexota bacterium]
MQLAGQPATPRRGGAHRRGGWSRLSLGADANPHAGTLAYPNAGANRDAWTANSDTDADSHAGTNADADANANRDARTADARGNLRQGLTDDRVRGDGA